MTHDAAEPMALKVVRHLDLVFLVLALALFVAADFPLLGYAAGAGAWVLQRGIQILANRQVGDSRDPKTVVGITAGSMIGRGWLVALIIFGAGLAAGDDVGLSAALLFIALFTIYFTTNIVVRPFDEAERKGTP